MSLSAMICIAVSALSAGATVHRSRGSRREDPLQRAIGQDFFRTSDVRIHDEPHACRFKSGRPDGTRPSRDNFYSTPKWWLFHRFFIFSTILGGSACRAAAFRQCFSCCAAVMPPFQAPGRRSRTYENFFIGHLLPVMIGNIIGGSTVVARRVLVCVFAREGNGVALQQGPASLNRPGIGCTMSIESQRTETSRQRPGLALLRYLPPVRWLADYRMSWLTGDVVAGVTLAAYAIPVSLAYADARRLAAAGRHLRLPARRARLCVARLVAPARDRADFRHLADDRRHRRGDGRGRRRALRPDRQPGGLHGGRCFA